MEWEMKYLKQKTVFKDFSIEWWDGDNEHKAEAAVVDGEITTIRISRPGYTTLSMPKKDDIDPLGWLEKLINGLDKLYNELVEELD
jgi:hypothetical protein